jgi:hypothetical protein
MFMLRFWTDCHPRIKKGRPPQRTTGVARAISSQPSVPKDASFSRGRPGKKSAMVTRNKGTVSTALHQKRLRILMSSALSSSSTATVRGSSAMPHFGQLPGASRTTSGCMGQVHSVLAAGASAVNDSSAIPHFGQLPGPTCRISGCMGQVNSAPSTIFSSSDSSWREGGPPPLADMYRSGLSRNFARQPALQNR